MFSSRFFYARDLGHAMQFYPSNLGLHFAIEILWSIDGTGIFWVDNRPTFVDADNECRVLKNEDMPVTELDTCLILGMDTPYLKF